MSVRGREIAGTFGRHLLAGSMAVNSDARRRGRARHLRLACEELGPTFLKVGQLVSVRPDVFGPEMVFEMEKLQDTVSALPASEIRGVIESEYGRRVEELFDEFDDRPVAAASIAQVHRGRLRQDYRPVIGPVLRAGSPVAIKVVRPGIEAAMSADIAEARVTARRVASWPRLRRYSIDGLVEEFASTLVSECDLRNEARVADRFAFDFRDDPLMVVPRVIWPLTSRRVLTTEFVDGWRLSDLEEAGRRGIDGRRLAEHGAAEPRMAPTAPTCLYATTRPRPDLWEAEIAIPLATLGIDPARDRRLAFNLTVRKGDDNLWLMWVPTGGNSYNVALAGILELQP